MAAKVLCEAGARRRHARSRRDVGHREGLEDVGVAVRLAAPRRRDAGQAVRRVRRLHRRLGHRRASRTRRRRARGSTGSAGACSAAAPTTGAASRCAWARTTSGAAASTASATTGRSPTTTSSRTTTSSIASSGIFGSMENIAERAGRRLPAAAEAALLRAADQAGGRQAEHHLHSQPPVDPHAAAERPAGVPLLRPVRPRLLDALELLVAVGAACRRRSRPASCASSPTRWRARC